jgi:hypothetical protein
LQAIAPILKRPVMGKILTSVGLEPQLPHRAPAREAVPHLAG